MGLGLVDVCAASRVRGVADGIDILVVSWRSFVLHIFVLFSSTPRPPAVGGEALLRKGFRQKTRRLSCIAVALDALVTEK